MYVRMRARDLKWRAFIEVKHKVAFKVTRYSRTRVQFFLQYGPLVCRQVARARSSTCFKTICATTTETGDPMQLLVVFTVVLKVSRCQAKVQ